MRLEELAVIQKISQMGHKPPVVESNAEETQGGEIRKQCVEGLKFIDRRHDHTSGSCALYRWIYLPAVLDDLMDVKLKGSQ